MKLAKALFGLQHVSPIATMLPYVTRAPALHISFKIWKQNWLSPNSTKCIDMFMITLKYDLHELYMHSNITKC